MPSCTHRILTGPAVGRPAAEPLAVFRGQASLFGQSLACSHVAFHVARSCHDRLESHGNPWNPLTTWRNTKTDHDGAALPYQVPENTLNFAGWGGRIRTSLWRNQNPLPYRLGTPQQV